MRSRRRVLCGVVVAFFLAPAVAVAKSTPPAKRGPERAAAAASERAPEHAHERGPDHPHERAASPTAKTAVKKAKPPPRPERKVRPLPPNATWKKWRMPPWKRGYVTLAGHGKKWSGFLVDKYGDPIPAARAALSAELGSWRTGKTTDIDDRLVRLIADVSDEFGGRPIRVVSGYREHSYAPDSRHKTGEAFDFSIPDVPNEAVRDFLRSLGDVGVGYYPNSTHVHLDVRDKLTYWVDYSRPGDRPVYAWDKPRTGMTSGERLLASALDAIAARAKSEPLGGTTVHPHDVTPAAATHAKSKIGEPAAPLHASGEPVRTHVAEADGAEDEREDGSDDAPRAEARAPGTLDAGRVTADATAR